MKQACGQQDYTIHSAKPWPNNSKQLKIDCIILLFIISSTQWNSVLPANPWSLVVHSKLLLADLKKLVPGSTSWLRAITCPQVYIIEQDNPILRLQVFITMGSNQMQDCVQPAYSLVGFRQSLSASQQCFSLTTNQHQSGLSVQKPTSEQAEYLKHGTPVIGHMEAFPSP